MRTFGLIALASIGLCACASTDADEGVTPVEAEGLDARVELADDEFVLRDYDKALQNYQAVYLAAKSRGETKLMTECAAQIAATLAIQAKMDESATWMGKAEADASESEPRPWTRVLLAKGVRAWRSNEPELARGTFVRLYNYCFIHNMTPRAIQAAYLVAQTSRGQERLDWVKRAIDAASSTGNARWESDLWLMHAMFLEQFGRYDQALESYGSARAIASTGLTSRLDKLKTDWAYGHGLRLVGRLDEARDLLVEANAIGKSIYARKPSPRAAEFLGRVIAEIGRVDAIEGKKDKARSHFLSAIEKFREAGALLNAPGEIRTLEEELRALDAPPNKRKIPARQ